jgi:hypothetical protein
MLFIQPEMGKILEVLVLEYDFGGTRTRTRTRKVGTRTRTRTRGTSTRTCTRTRRLSTRTRTRAFIIPKDEIVYGRFSAPKVF